MVEFSATVVIEIVLYNNYTASEMGVRNAIKKNKTRNKNTSLHIELSSIHVADSWPCCIRYKKPRVGAESELAMTYSTPAW